MDSSSFASVLFDDVRYDCSRIFGLTGSVMAQTGYYSTFGEAFSLREGEERLEVSYRQHTAPSLTEFNESGVLVDWLE